MGDVRCRSPHADPVEKWFRTASDNRRAIASTSLAPAPDRHRFGKGTDQIRSDLASAGFEKAGSVNQTGARDVGVGDRHSSVKNKRSSWPNSLVAGNVTHSMFRICQIKHQKQYFMVRP